MADSLTSIFSLTKPEVNVSTTWPTSLNGDLDSLDDLLARPKTVFNSPTVGATTTLDLSLARTFVFTVSQTTTLAFSNVPSASFAVGVRLLVTNGSAFVLTFPASIVWVRGSAPTLIASGVDIIDLITKDGGTTWYARPWYPRNPVGSFTTTDSGAGSPANLKSYVIPAGLLAVDGQGVRVRGWGYSANNANAKSARVTLASFTLGQTLQVSIQDYWHLDVTIYRASATTVSIVAVGQDAGTAAESLANGVGLTVNNLGTLTNTVQFDCVQTAAVDVSQVGLTVERL